MVNLDELELPAVETDALTTLYLKEVIDRILAFPEGQRLVAIMVYVEGNTYREAADKLGIPIGTVMSRLAAVRAKLAPLIVSANEDTEVSRRAA